MKLLFKTLIALALPLSARAEVTIFEVRKTLSLSDSDPVFRDFYINAGSEAGLSNGMIITVSRRLPLYDTYSNRSAGDLELKVAKVRIIHVQRGLSVARLHSEFTRANSPLLEDPFIMVGDRLDLNTVSTSGDSDSKGDDKGKEEKGKDDKAPEKKSENDNQEEQKPPEPVASTKPEGQILVNSVEMSSEAPKLPTEPPTPQKVDAPSLQ